MNHRWVSPLLIATALILPTTAFSKDEPIKPDLEHADFGPKPENVEELIKAWAADNLKDPESARFSKLTQPRKEWMVVNLQPFYGWSVCVDITAKNSYGGYVGANTYWFLLRDGKIERGQSTVGFPGKMISRGHSVNCDDGAE